MLNLSGVENLAITGANGFVGKSIAELISTIPSENLPQRITFISRNGINFQLDEKIKNRSVDIVQDLTEPWNFQDQISHFLNLAADGSRQPYSIEACLNFTKISENLVDWLKRADNEVHIFHASSGACFGSRSLTEENPATNPKEIFIRNRVEVENYLTRSISKMNHTLSVGRLFSFSGKNILEKSQYALSSFINSAVSTSKIQITGDPLTVRSYLHQTAMSEWILRALISPIPYTDLQIGSNESLTLKDLADFVAEETDASVEYSTNSKSGDIYIPDNQDTRIKLGVGEGMGWKAAVREMIYEARKLINAN
jgi:dTDP-glucose 4,6-dehydratase